MAGVPVAQHNQQVDLARLSLRHYSSPRTSESHDRSLPSTPQYPSPLMPRPRSNSSSAGSFGGRNSTAGGHDRPFQPASPVSSVYDASSSPSGGGPPSTTASGGARPETPASNASVPLHSTTMVVDSDPDLTAGTALGSLQQCSPSLQTWDMPTKPHLAGDNGGTHMYPFPGYSHPSPVYDPAAASPAPYPRATPYYVPVSPMHTLETPTRESPYDRRKRVEEQMRREREMAKSRRHVCPVCDKRFNRPSSLNTHMSVHTAYQCNYDGCGRRFSVSSNLRRHERTHEARGRPAPLSKQSKAVQQQQQQRQAAVQGHSPYRAAPGSQSSSSLYSSPVQPTMFVQASPAPANITYPYTYPSSSPHSSHSYGQTPHGSHATAHSHGHAGANTQTNAHHLSPTTMALSGRYAYQMGGISPAPTRLFPASLIHTDMQMGPGSGGSSMNSSATGNGNGSGASHSQATTQPVQQSIFMPQPTKSKTNSLMLG